jgi:ABC-type amino acid transport substrate-binding protein
LLSWLVLASLSLVGIAAAQTPEAPTAESAAHAAGSSHLRGGWYPWDPYQYREYRHGVSILTGFDVEIERALARIMRVEISLPPMPWEEHLAALADGRADIASGATASEERSAFAYVSKPYRTETDVLILPKGAGRRYPFRTIEQMLDTFARQRFRLGVIAGYAYADARVNAFIAEPANRDQIVTVASDADNLQNLLDGVIDGFLADRVAANTTAWRNKQAALPAADRSSSLRCWRSSGRQRLGSRPMTRSLPTLPPRCSRPRPPTGSGPMPSAATCSAGYWSLPASTCR